VVQNYLAGVGEVDGRFDEGGCDGCTLLHAAADGGQAKVARLLLDRGADPNAVAGHGRTPLHFAVGGQSAEVVRLLLRRGAVRTIETQDEWGNTPLLVAAASVVSQARWLHTPEGAIAGSNRAREPSAEIIETLLEAGADVNGPSGKGNTPLHIAAYKGFASTVQLLLARGADPAARNAAGETPEALALRYGKAEVVEALRRWPGPAGRPGP
jgi:ankyrin repeat protein